MSVAEDGPADLGTGLVLFFAAAIAAIVLSLYASQPLIGLIAIDFNLSPSTAALVPMVTMLGYAVGLFFVVPLVDLAQNRNLVVGTLALMAISLAGVALAPTVAVLLFSSAVVGIMATAVQMLVPIVAGLVSDKQRPGVLGVIQSGIIVGILLSRPLASLIAQFFGWQSYYYLAALLMAALAGVLWFIVEDRPRASTEKSYLSLIRSLLTLVLEERTLQRRSLNQFFLMAGFGLFWTAVTLRLSSAPFNLSQIGLALFALAGVSGAIVSPFAGKISKRGWTTGATVLAHCSAIAAFVISGLIADGGWAIWSTTKYPIQSFVTLLACAVLLDLGVVTDQVLGRIAINSIRAEVRGRVNALFTGMFFIGGSIGAGLAGAAWANGGWVAVSSTGLSFAVLALIAQRCFGPRRHSDKCL